MEKAKLLTMPMPGYSRSEENFNMISHTAGAVFAVFALVLCVIRSALFGDAWSVTSSAIYGASLIAVYTVSSVYHGLGSSFVKRVMRVIDHCTIYFLIAGTYTPIVLCSIRKVSPGWGWTLFGIVWGLAAVATVFTAVDMLKFSKISMTCYIGMGWCIVLAAKTAIEAIPLPGLLWLIGGGISYTLGAIIYNLGKSHKYLHSVFHLFVVAGSILQFFCVFFYII